jgi:DNA-binding transcriptional LysR family regulator
VRLSDIDLNLLVVFEAIHREQNLTRAAQRLGLTQPALSHALGRLRDLLQDPLFTRTGRQMVPTAFARSLIVPVREALLTLEHGLFPNQAFEPARAARRFVIGLRDVLETVWLPLLVEHLRSAPQLSLVSTRVARSELETELVTGVLDLAIEIPLPVSAALRHQAIAEERLVVMARRDHPAAGDLTLERYLEHSHVIVSSRRSGPGLEDAALRSLGRRRRISLRCQNFHAACQIVQESDLLLTLPERLAQALKRGSDQRILPFPVPAPSLAIHMYWHTASDNDPANRWLREQVLGLTGAL